MASKSRPSYQVSVLPVTVFAHLIVIAVTILVFVWLLHFLEGLAFKSNIKAKIFNVVPMPITYYLLDCFYTALRSDVQCFDFFGIVLQVHPFLMFIGFVLVVGEAIMAYKTVPAKKEVQKVFHLTLHFIAPICGILGIYAVFKFHHEVGNPDMYTLHSWLGMSTICLFGLQVPSSI
ncbi:unnamed protein product [Ilex paraguariensis]|uniref:Cytochrome b561 domain-containing protein n=1 Tax=Ilex paraguariensis TaxID=185542 RepID=A0ABC8TM10_9AQUA